MKYLLFINFSNGLMHNNIYDALGDVRESIEQLVLDEELEITKEAIPTTDGIKRYLEKSDDYFGQLSSGTWYHVQPHPIFA